MNKTELFEAVLRAFKKALEGLPQEEVGHSDRSWFVQLFQAHPHPQLPATGEVTLQLLLYRGTIGIQLSILGRVQHEETLFLPSDGSELEWEMLIEDLEPLALSWVNRVERWVQRIRANLPRLRNLT